MSLFSEEIIKILEIYPLTFPLKLKYRFELMRQLYNCLSLLFSQQMKILITNFILDYNENVKVGKMVKTFLTERAARNTANNIKESAMVMIDNKSLNLFGTVLRAEKIDAIRTQEMIQMDFKMLVQKFVTSDDELETEILNFNGFIGDDSKPTKIGLVLTKLLGKLRYV